MEAPVLDKKAAKKLAQENLRKQIAKDTLLREQALDEATRKKIKDKWVGALIDAKIPEMQDNLRYILHYMEKLIEADNFRKMLFENERQELHEMTTLQAQSHRSALDMLYDIYQGRVRDLNEAFNLNVSHMKTKAMDEFKAIEEHETQVQENLHNMLYQMTQNRDKKEDTMNCVMFLKLDDERSKNAEKYENLRLQVEHKMEKRWGEITNTLTDYEQATKARKKDYDQLKAKDDADSKIIYQQVKKTQKLFEQLEELKNCNDNCYAPREKLTLIEDLREERTKFFNTFKQMKSLLDDELSVDKSNLKNLTTTTSNLTKDLKSLCELGEHILTLLRICLKFETESEKVTPVGSSIGQIKPHLETGKTKHRNVVEETVVHTQDAGNFTKDFDVLHNFWKKVGRVHISILTLTKYVQNLEKENAILKRSLTSYLRQVALKGSKK